MIGRRTLLQLVALLGFGCSKLRRAYMAPELRGSFPLPAAPVAAPGETLAIAGEALTTGDLVVWGPDGRVWCAVRIERGTNASATAQKLAAAIHDASGQPVTVRPSLGPKGGGKKARSEDPDSPEGVKSHSSDVTSLQS